MKFGIPHVLMIDEENREGAVGNVGNGALAILQVGELRSTMLVGVHLGVLKQEHNNFVVWSGKSDLTTRSIINCQSTLLWWRDRRATVCQR